MHYPPEFLTHFGEVLTEALCEETSQGDHADTDVRLVDCTYCLGILRESLVKRIRMVDARIIATAQNVKYTLLVHRAPYESTNEWNNFSGIDWEVMTRGIFTTRNEACAWAREHLLPGAPFTVSPTDCSVPGPSTEETHETDPGFGMSGTRH
jgi:hypothetical protein